MTIPRKSNCTTVQLYNCICVLCVVNSVVCLELWHKFSSIRPKRCAKISQTYFEISQTYFEISQSYLGIGPIPCFIGIGRKFLAKPSGKPIACLLQQIYGFFVRHKFRLEQCCVVK